jgi:hypothetical protein
MNSEKNDSEQALVIKLKLQTQLGSPQERTRIFDLEDRLQQAIEELGVGEFDGDEFGDAECSLYLYGSDANRLFEGVVKKISNRELLVQLYPRLYHMAHAGAWPSIERLGLLSTTALLDLFEVNGSRREELEAGRRSRSEPITHAKHGQALLRDQIPLNEIKLANALHDGLTPQEWYRILNRKVFFWGPQSRLSILRGAREYEADRQTIVVVDAARLVARHGDRVLLCHMNSGATQPMAFPRGKKTFLPIDQYPLAERRKKYGPKGAVAEVTVDYSVPDVREFVIEAYETGGGEKRKDFV